MGHTDHGTYHVEDGGYDSIPKALRVYLRRTDGRYISDNGKLDAHEKKGRSIPQDDGDGKGDDVADTVGEVEQKENVTDVATDEAGQVDVVAPAGFQSCGRIGSRGQYQCGSGMEAPDSWGRRTAEPSVGVRSVLHETTRAAMDMTLARGPMVAATRLGKAVCEWYVPIGWNSRHRLTHGMAVEANHQSSSSSSSYARSVSFHHVFVRSSLGKGPKSSSN